MNVYKELDFSKSKYKYNNEGLTYVFSTENNKNKFINKLEDYKRLETLRIKSMYSQLNINFDLFLSLPANT